MSTGDLAKEMQAAPLTRSEKKFRAEDAEELPEIRKRKLGLPPSEVRRQEKKRLEKAKKKKDKKKDQKSKKKEGKDESPEKDQEEEDEDESPEEDKEEREEGPEKDQEEEDLEKEEDEEMDKEESSEPELIEENDGDEDEEAEEDKNWQEWNPKAGSADSARGWGPSGWYRRQQSHFWSGQYSEGKWEHDQWEDKKRSLYDPEESDRQTRPRIDFTHLKIQKALDVSRGKMGDSSEEEEPKEEQKDEIKGLPRTPTGDTGSDEETEGEAEEEEEKPEEGENQEVEDEGEETKDPGGEEEVEAQGDLNSFEAPIVSYKPSPNGPEGKDWTRVYFIVDSGASDSTILKRHFA